jgi:hypothetical protein
MGRIHEISHSKRCEYKKIQGTKIIILQQESTENRSKLIYS